MVTSSERVPKKDCDKLNTILIFSGYTTCLMSTWFQGTTYNETLLNHHLLFLTIHDFNLADSCA